MTEQALTFTPATKRDSRLRLALVGPAGSGKTYTALAVATALGSGPIAVIDTEHGSASKYADVFTFDALALDTHHPETYIAAIKAAGRARYKTLIIDSLSHAWNGRGGALELVDNIARKSQSSSTFAAWRDVTPLHNELVETMLRTRMHVIATLRAKTEYAMEEYQDGGRRKTRVVKLGLAPVQREGLDYEFDVVGDLTIEHDLIISKTRCSALAGQQYRRAGAELAGVLRGWLGEEAL